MASPGNPHCAKCIGTLLFPMCGEILDEKCNKISCILKTVVQTVRSCYQVARC